MRSFFPLAILILDANDKGTVETDYMTALHPFATLGDDDVATVDVWRQPVFHPGWPERPDGQACC